MTPGEQVKRIIKLLNELSLDEITYEEFEEEFLKGLINDTKEEMWLLWLLYCFANDVCDTLNM